MEQSCRTTTEILKGSPIFASIKTALSEFAYNTLMVYVISCDIPKLPIECYTMKLHDRIPF